MAYSWVNVDVRTTGGSMDLIDIPEHRVPPLRIMGVFDYGPGVSA